jgi:hypothetical protein
MVKAIIAKRSICTCGFPLFDESVPNDRIYLVIPETISDGWTFVCGGCGNRMRCKAVQDETGGWLPLEALKFVVN